MYKLIICFYLLFYVTNALGQDNPHEEVPFGCEECHSTEVWRDVDFDHRNTGFELEGHHLKQNCNSCHQIANFSHINPECNSCHKDVHQSKLLKQCGTCHTPYSWTIIDANQAHANTTFQIIGAHAKLDCWSCHRNEIMAEFHRPQSNCFSCHQNDFLIADNPKHTLNSFSTRCEDCHSFIAWRPATFGDHDNYFPIFSGEHAGKWSSCANCHFNPASYAGFTCLNCHAHRQSKMDDEHRRISGYSYESQSCYYCHPRGEED